MKNQILPVSKITEVTDYPYGRLRTSAFFSVEFVKNKGFRSVFQTIDPKNGRVNKPKKGTYSPLGYCYIHTETGHIKFGGWGSCYGDEGVNKLAAHLAAVREHLELTGEMIEHICTHMLLTLKAGLHWTHPSSRAAVIELVNPTIEALVNGIKNKEIDFAAIILPCEEIEKIRKEGEQIKFEVVNHQVIGS